MSDSVAWRRRPSSGQSDRMIIKIPLHWSHWAFVWEGAKQSRGKHYKVIDEDEVSSTREVQITWGSARYWWMTIGTLNLGQTQRWVCSNLTLGYGQQRVTTSQHKSMLVSAATATVLPKTNKLSATRIIIVDNKFLAQVLNLQSHFKTIRAHLISYDIFNIMTIVIPVNLLESPGKERWTYNLYPQLHAVCVANNCT